MQMTELERADMLEVPALLDMPGSEALAVLEGERPAKDPTVTS
jgi:hypothetical protein